MNMQPLNESEYDAWDRFVARANGTVFHYAWWYKAWSVKFDIYARKDENGDIVAGMPVYISNFRRMPKVFGIKGLTRPPLTVENGPLFLDSAKASRCSKYTHAKKETLNAISSLPKTGFYDILLHSFQVDLMPYIWNGFDTQVYYTYVIPKEEAGVWRENMYDEARRSLKVAHNDGGYSIETDPPLDEMMPLFLETARLRGYALDRYASRMPRWWDQVKEKKAGRLYVIRDGDGEALCVNLVIWDTHTAYDILGGKKEKARHGNLNMLLYERMITDSFEMGLNFDFEGSILKGVEGFIRRWGGELRPCFRVMKIPSIVTYAGLKGYRYLKFHRKTRWVE